MIRMVFVKLANGKSEELDAVDLPLDTGENVIVETEKGLVLGKAPLPTSRKGETLLSKISKKGNPKSHS